MGALTKIGKIFIYTLPLLHKIWNSDKSFFEGIYFVYKAKKYGNISLEVLTQTDYMDYPDTFMSVDTYIEHGLVLNNFAFREALNNKLLLFKRIPEYMQRDYLDINNATDAEILEFAKKHRKFAGKCNLRVAAGFQDFLNTEDNLVKKIRTSKVELLEEWIEQHEQYACINDSSVNTIRIHTLRTTEGCKVCFFIELRVGSKGIIHDMETDGKAQYTVELTTEGCIDHARKSIHGKHIICYEHEDSHYQFAKGKSLPFVKEAQEMCCMAAERIPEFRFIGWDIAITPKGPMIVEANVLSGAFYNRQNAHAMVYGRGNKQEAIDVFSEGMENIVYDNNCNLQAISFADLSYLKGENKPDALQQFLVLLESALHNHGVEFYDITQKKATCSILVNHNKKALLLQNGKTKHCLELPVYIPDNIYEADKLARKLAGTVYTKLMGID